MKIVIMLVALIINALLTGFAMLAAYGLGVDGLALVGVGGIASLAGWIWLASIWTEASNAVH
jgi:hypothetical protein